MQIFKEWFFWQESDLFFFGIGIILICILLPWKKNRKNYAIILICFLAYILSELAAALPKTDMLGAILSIFAGGIGISIAIGRCIRLIFHKLTKSHSIS